VAWHPHMIDALAPVHDRCPGTRTWSMPWHPYMIDALAPAHRHTISSPGRSPARSKGEAV